MARTALPEIRVAVLGAGLIGQLHSHAYRRLGDLRHSLPANVRLAVVADVHESLAEEVADRFGFERTAKSWEEVADAKDVDAATVALPNHEHRPAVEGTSRVRKARPLRKAAGQHRRRLVGIAAGGAPGRRSPRRRFQSEENAGHSRDQGRPGPGRPW